MVKKIYEIVIDDEEVLKKLEKIVKELEGEKASKKQGSNKDRQQR